MTVKASTSLDLEAFGRGYEEWDIEALLALYADEVELIQFDRDNPPGSPGVRHGKEVFKGMFEHCAAAGVKATVENAVAGEDRAAATVTCELPGGRKVVANAILELRDGTHRPRAGGAGGRPKGVNRPMACDSAGEQRESAHPSNRR